MPRLWFRETCRLSSILCMSGTTAGYRQLGSCSQLPRAGHVASDCLAGLDNLIDALWHGWKLQTCSTQSSANVATPAQMRRCSCAAASNFLLSHPGFECDDPAATEQCKSLSHPGSTLANEVENKAGDIGSCHGIAMQILL
jgi:hypothetical protein